MVARRRKSMQSRAVFISLFILTFLSGCRHKSETLPPSPKSGASSGSVRFREVAAEAGLHYQWTAPGKRPLNILQTIGNGCAFLDYDQDGNLDVLLVGPKPALFKGDGKGHFTDVTAETGIGALQGYFLGVAVGDYDNDGFPDVYLSGYREARMLHNDGGKGFRDVTAALGLKPQPWGSSAGFADLDGDGYLDLYVCNYAAFDPKTIPQLCKFQTKDQGEVLSSCGPRYYKGIQGVMYHSQGGKRFEDVTKTWGFDTHNGRGLGVAFADIDGSGRMATAVANDEAPGDLFHRPGAGMKNENIGEVSGVARDRNGTLHGGMGVDWGDYNNDGKFDLFVATFRNEAKALYRNDGNLQFTDVSYPVGVARPALPYVTFGCKFLDADNDGWLDIILCNGHVQDNIKLIENTDFPQPVVFMRNAPPGQFEDETQSSGIGALPPIVGRGLATGDYDNDGRVDVLIVDSEGKPMLLHNESGQEAEGKGQRGSGSAWVGFRCVDKNRRDAYGAILTLEANGVKQMRQCQSSGSYLSASDPRVHFGLGRETKAVSLTVRWPDGKTKRVENLTIDAYHTLTEE